MGGEEGEKMLATGTFATPSPRGLILEELLVHQANLTQRGILLLLFFFPPAAPLFIITKFFMHQNKGLILQAVNTS